MGKKAKVIGTSPWLTNLFALANQPKNYDEEEGLMNIFSKRCLKRCSIWNKGWLQPCIGTLHIGISGRYILAKVIPVTEWQYWRNFSHLEGEYGIRFQEMEFCTIVPLINQNQIQLIFSTEKRHTNTIWANARNLWPLWEQNGCWFFLHKIQQYYVYGIYVYVYEYTYIPLWSILGQNEFAQIER